MVEIGQLRPMLASLAGDLPTGPGWLYEPKWDGFRCLTVVDEAGAAVYSRRGTDLTDAFPDVAAAAAGVLPAGTIVDGEIVRWAPAGSTSRHCSAATAAPADPPATWPGPSRATSSSSTSCTPQTAT